MGTRKFSGVALVMITFFICATYAWTKTVDEMREFFLDIRPLMVEVTQQNLRLSEQNALLRQQNEQLRLYHVE